MLPPLELPPVLLLPVLLPLPSKLIAVVAVGVVGVGVGFGVGTTTDDPPNVKPVLGLKLTPPPHGSTVGLIDGFITIDGLNGLTFSVVVCDPVFAPLLVVLGKGSLPVDGAPSLFLLNPILVATIGSTDILPVATIFFVLIPDALVT